MKLPWRKAGLLISMIKWIRSSRLSFKNYLFPYPPELPPGSVSFKRSNLEGIAAFPPEIGITVPIPYGGKGGGVNEMISAIRSTPRQRDEVPSQRALRAFTYNAAGEAERTA